MPRNYNDADRQEATVNTWLFCLSWYEGKLGLTLKSQAELLLYSYALTKPVMVILLLVMALIVLSALSSHVLADEAAPAYSVTMSMGEREIYGSHRVVVTLSIVGFGTISNGSLTVQSDARNIVVSTLGYRYCVVTWLGAGGQQAFCHPETLSSVTTGLEEIFAVQAVPTIDLPNGSELVLNGTFQVDMGSTPLGSHRLKATFAVQSGAKNYVFEDTIDYRTIGTLERYQILQNLAFLVFGAILSLLVAWSVQRRERESTRNDQRRERIYAPLFDELSRVRISLQNWLPATTPEYDKIQSAHLLYMVPMNLREQLRTLYETLLPELQNKILAIRERHQQIILTDLTASSIPLSGRPGSTVVSTSDPNIINLANNLGQMTLLDEIPGSAKPSLERLFQAAKQRSNLVQLSVDEYFVKISKKLRAEDTEMGSVMKLRKQAIESIDQIAKPIRKDLRTEA